MNFHHLAYWQDKALSLAIENRLFINGEYTAAAENETFETVDPVTQAPLAKIARGKSVDIDRAMSAARAYLNAATGHSLLRLNVKRY